MRLSPAVLLAALSLAGACAPTSAPPSLEEAGGARVTPVVVAAASSPAQAAPDPDAPAPAPALQAPDLRFGYGVHAGDMECKDAAWFQKAAVATCATRAAQLEGFVIDRTTPLPAGVQCAEGTRFWMHVTCGAPLARVEEAALASDVMTYAIPGDEASVCGKEDPRAAFEARGCSPLTVPVDSQPWGEVCAADGSLWGGTYRCGITLARPEGATAFHAVSVGTAGECTALPALRAEAEAACAADGATLTEVLPVAAGACGGNAYVYAWAGCATAAAAP